VTRQVLLFADDMVVKGETPDDLQLSLSRLQDYCNTWSLKVNISKIKVLVFRKRSNIRANEKWIYANDNLDVTGSFNLNNQTVYGKGLKALNVLLSNLKNMIVNK